MGRELFFFSLSHDSESRSLLCLLLSIDKQHCGLLHIFKEILAELQAGHRDLCTQLTEPHLPLDLLTWLQSSPP